MKSSKIKTHYYGNTLALLAGAVLTLAFAPFSLFPLAILSPALLLWLWLSITPKQAFWRGWLYGLGFFGTSVYWVFISIYTFGNASVFLATLITGSFIALLALFPACQGYLLNRYFPENNGRKMICAFSALWVLLEWVRSWFCSGFPWVLLGDSQIYSPLKGFAPVYGVYGVSLAVLLSSGILVHAYWNMKKRKYKSVYYSLAALIILWVIGGGLTFITWTKPHGKPIQVSLVQGNIPQEIKWSPNQLQLTLDRYAKLTQAHWDSSIIIWPEDAIPLPLKTALPFLDELTMQAKQHHTSLVLGIPVKNESNQNDEYFNTVIAIGAYTDAYVKHHLVPFGEYTPMPSLLKPIMRLFNIPMSNFIPSTGLPKSLEINGITIATFICYEIAYPELVVSHDSSMGMLLTVSNDAWFGQSIASAQHLAIAQMRAIEMGRPLLFVSNTGITAIIKPNGKLQSVAPLNTPFVLTGTVQPMAGKTFWQRRPMDPILILLVLLLYSTIKYRRQQKKKKLKNKKLN
ncbi:MAG: lnt [Gammaproteobacteria bacterium]|jgi:apolipoprotein N-acyltransferase|nr:lnt [Gammaproteobacteria bacterium]MCE3237908.1 lnt [Gammaproteobacteria bacterium]